MTFNALTSVNGFYEMREALPEHIRKDPALTFHCLYGGQFRLGVSACRRSRDFLSASFMAHSCACDRAAASPELVGRVSRQYHQEGCMIQVMHPDLFRQACPYPWGNRVIQRYLDTWSLSLGKIMIGSWSSVHCDDLCPLLRAHLAPLIHKRQVELVRGNAREFAIKVWLSDLTLADVDILNAAIVAVSLIAEDW